MSRTKSKIKAFGTALAAAGLLVLSGCGGTKVLDDAKPVQATQPLANHADQQLAATLDWVVVRDGPGSWAKNADWDEYQLRVHNLSGEPIHVTGIVVVDSLDARISPEADRKKLVKSTKRTAKRYKGSGIKVRAGAGTGTMLATGAVITVVGMGAAEAVAIGSALGSTAGAGAGVAGGILLIGPVLVIGGLVRHMNNSEVHDEIVQRHTPLPLVVEANQELALEAFFPLSPSPKLVELTYTDAQGEHQLILDTSQALDGLHLEKG